MVGMTRDSMVSVVVPLCNEEANLPELRARLTAALAHHEFECILVDDGSTDATSAMIRDVAREDPRFKVVSLSRNFGHQAAIFAGLTFARGACVVVMDGDLQDPPEVIPEMVRAWRKGAEVVYGVRTARKEGWFTRATAAAFYRIQVRLTRTRMPLDTGDFAAMDRRVVDLIVSISERHPYVRGLRSWVGFRQVAFPYERDRRHRGRPKYTVWKLLGLEAPRSGRLGDRAVLGRPAATRGPLGRRDLGARARGGTRRAPRMDAVRRRRGGGARVPLRSPAPHHRPTRRVRRSRPRGGAEPPDLRRRRGRRGGSGPSDRGPEARRPAHELARDFPPGNPVITRWSPAVERRDHGSDEPWGAPRHHSDRGRRRPRQHRLDPAHGGSRGGRIPHRC